MASLKKIIEALMYRPTKFDRWCDRYEEEMMDFSPRCPACNRLSPFGSYCDQCQVRQNDPEETD